MKAILIVDLQGETLILEGTSISITTKWDYEEIQSISGRIERIPISREPIYEVSFVGRKTTDKELKQLFAGEKPIKIDTLLLQGKRRFTLGEA